MPDAEKQPKLTGTDKGMVALQGALQAVPYLGSSLHHFIFGPLTELRFKRIEKTLTEVAKRLGEEKAGAAVNEAFSALLEGILPELSRAMDEEKRHRFRDLLTNAARLPEQSEEWEEAALAASLLKGIETPGLSIIAGITRCRSDEPIVLTSRPVSQVYCGDYDYDSPGNPQHVLPYDWVIVEYWARQLREQGIITYSSHDARGGFGGVAIQELGKFLIRWIIANEP